MTTTIGLDTNILCYALDPAFPEHRKFADIWEKLSAEFMIGINPTVLHEAYHTLVYSQKWSREEARTRLGMLLRHPYIRFFNQTKSTCSLALVLAGKYDLGGRDSLILANFLANGISVIHTHDHELLEFRSVEAKTWRLRLLDPLTEGQPNLD